jgi:hypothetical protein
MEGRLRNYDAELNIMYCENREAASSGVLQLQ